MRCWNWPVVGVKGPERSKPQVWKGQGVEMLCRSSAGMWDNGLCSWHFWHFFTWSAASLFMVGQKYPARKDFLANDFPPIWWPQLPLCTSVRTYHVSDGPMHLSKGVDSPLLNSCPSIMEYREAFCTNRFASQASAGMVPLVIYSIIGVLQS